MAIRMRVFTLTSPAFCSGPKGIDTTEPEITPPLLSYQ